MYHLERGDYLFFGMFFWPLIAITLGAFGMRDGSLLCRSTPSTLVFRKRPALRACNASLSLWMLLAWLVFQMPEMLASLRQDGWPAWGWAALGLMVLIYGACAGLMLSLSGPEELRLELDKRTYRYRAGWPLFPKTVSGTWEDLEGVSVRQVDAYRNRGCTVNLAWKRSGRRALVARFRFREPADRFAGELAAKLGLPRAVAAS